MSPGSQYFEVKRLGVPLARTRPTRAETRRQVLDAAFEVFGQRGIAATSLTEVAAAAGLTKGAVYSNFDSKDELVLTLMEEHAGHRIQASLDAVDADGGADVFGQVAAVLVREMRADAVWHRLLAEYFALAHHDPRKQKALQGRRREVRATVARALVQVSEGLGFALPMPADDLAIVFLALSNGMAVESDIDPGGVPDDLLARVLTLIAGDAVVALREAAARASVD
ncbi:MAG: TetR family transcriptional regulator [Marmoricola sp.]|nr:TetR family transcriptional regulator [Marmoricola sp.]